jgi:hypothetical protein
MTTTDINYEASIDTRWNSTFHNDRSQAIAFIDPNYICCASEKYFRWSINFDQHQVRV